jgi:predicted ATPase/DNA-binding CsgD family transcriptional regulator
MAGEEAKKIFKREQVANVSEAFAADMLEERISTTMVGRSRETEMFKKQFDCVLEGGMGLTVISGPPGIGKSFFAERAAGMLMVGSATYVHGKFRQYDKSTLIAFSEIIEQVVKHILTLPGSALKNIKNELNKKIGADSGIILSLCPYAQILFETVKAVHGDNLEQLKYRVRKAVYQFLTTISAALFPLIIFIDDLQWADALSLNIIEALCQDYGFLNLHLVLAWRNDDSGKARLNPAKLPEGGDILIALDELQKEDIDQYIRLLFEQDIEHKEYLIRLLYGLTLGNPFNIGRVLRLFLQEKVIYYSSARKKWLVRPDKMEELNLPADIEQLLTRQIDSLEKEDKELLRLIACCGDSTFDLLTTLTGKEDALLNGELDRLCKNSLLVKTLQEEVCYGFTHDIVLKLTYNNMETEEKSKIHYHIAETLAEPENRRFTADSRLAVAVHLLCVDPPLLRRSKTEKWIEELYTAGVAAKQGAAAEQALEMFERCAGLLSGLVTKGKSDFDLRVHLELSECRFSCGQTEMAEKDFEALLAKYPETENQIRIKRKYIKLCAMNGNFEKVMELGAQILAHLSFRVDRKHFMLSLIKSRLFLTNKKISRLTTAPDITGKRLLYILETLTVMALAANRIDYKLSVIFALKLAVLSAQYGDSDYAPVAYGAYCYVLFTVMRDPEKGKRLEKAVFALIKKRENADSNSTAWFFLGAFSRHLTGTLEDTVACLKKSAAEGEKRGSSLFGSYANAFVIITSHMMGRHLDELQQSIDHCRRMPKRPAHGIVLYICEIYADHIRRLKDGVLPQEGRPHGEEQEGEDNSLFMLTVKLTGDIIELERLYLEGKIKEAYGLTTRLAPSITHFQGFILDVEYIYYNILVRLAMHRDLPAEKQRDNRMTVEKHLKELKYCIGIYKDNHYARYLLAQAEYDALFQPEKASDKPYLEAMDFAREQGNLPLEALAGLLAAKYHSGSSRLSGFYGAEAMRLYRKWGATHIGDLIARNMGLVCDAACSLEERMIRSGKLGADTEKKEERDILLHLSGIEKMQEDEGYLYLLDVLTRQIDVDYCAVFFEKSDEMHLKYERRKGEEGRVYRDLINMNHLGSLPHKIIRYVARTETEILMDKKEDWGIFANSSCLAEKDGVAFLCLPIKYSGVLIGIIYIERTGRNVFDDRLPAFVKSFIPALLSKKTVVREVNVQSLLNPQYENSLFTARELEVLKLVAEGMSNSEIGQKLHITQGTVKNHLRNIYAKLEADNRVKAVARAKELKILQT